jgi:hypothetical protein
MAGPLLETKLHVPRLRRGLVARPRLSERLSRGAERAGLRGVPTGASAVVPKFRVAVLLMWHGHPGSGCRLILR